MTKTITITETEDGLLEMNVQGFTQLEIWSALTWFGDNIRLDRMTRLAIEISKRKSENESDK